LCGAGRFKRSDARQDTRAVVVPPDRHAPDLLPSSVLVVEYPVDLLSSVHCQTIIRVHRRANPGFFWSIDNESVPVPSETRRKVSPPLVKFRSLARVSTWNDCRPDARIVPGKVFLLSNLRTQVPDSVYYK